MFTVHIETIRSSSTQRLAARDLDHAIAIADFRKEDKDTVRIYIKRGARLVSEVVNKRTQYNEWAY